MCVWIVRIYRLHIRIEIQEIVLAFSFLSLNMIGWALLTQENSFAIVLLGSYAFYSRSLSALFVHVKSM